MSTSMMVADWIKRIADEERRRDSLRLREDTLASQKADLIRQSGQRLVDDLRSTIVRDVEAFRAEFPGDPTRDVVVEATAPNGGFTVRRPGPAAVSLTVAPNLAAAAMVCHYSFTLSDGFPPRKDRLDMVFANDGDAALHLKHQGTGQVFSSAEALSELLLVPVFTGRPQ
jgi:hypothetical protein